ncbi:MAG TPA: hypothetical protein VEZ55_03410, partial [Chitinophagaceae bacterium]|nr:hypothetical protein [Chitinophagaceae bacterium]
MKKHYPFINPSILRSLFFILIYLYSFVAIAQPQLSVVTDKSPGASVNNGLSKLMGALKSKSIQFEKVNSVDEARGKVVIVAGLSTGNGEAAQLLQTAKRTTPAVPEALTIWKTDYKKKIVWVVSGFDERGLMYALLDVADRVSWSS